jgi:O-antigen ligase/polysaccharide polymerase Wzy-like membrane protein
MRWNSSGALDAMLAFLAGAVLLQFVPVPLPGSSRWISPHRGDVVGALRLETPTADSFPAWSIDVPSTVWAFAVLAGTIVLFWIARTEFRRGGVRQIARAVSALGLGVSLLAVAQAATANGRIYWTFATGFEGPPPFGPFVNRNHFATWAIMAVPLCFGYLAARLGTDRPAPKHSSLRRRIVLSIDPRTAWLTMAGGTMLVALLLSLSRSGVLALGISTAITFLIARRRLEHRHRRLVLQATLAILVLAVLWSDVPALMRRAAGAPTAVADRLTIWRESLPIVRDFWQVGTGAGTYQVAMAVYQRSDRSVYFNQAHNHYLQIAVEGGVLILALAIGCAAAFVREARRRIAADTSGLVLIRVGAACGLGAVALQSVWETGLVMPANAALAAVLAAIVVHERD